MCFSCINLNPFLIFIGFMFIAQAIINIWTGGFYARRDHAYEDEPRYLGLKIFVTFMTGAMIVLIGLVGIENVWETFLPMWKNLKHTFGY